MSESDVHAAAEAAVAAGHRDGYLIALVSPTIQPALSALTNRDVRRRLHEASVSRAKAAPFDNAPAAAEIAALRAERAALLGFATHADYVTADATAGTTAAVDGLLGRCPRRWSPRPVVSRNCSPGSPPPTAWRWPRGTGRSTPNASGPRSTRWTTRPCASTSNWPRPGRRRFRDGAGPVRGHLRGARGPHRLPPGRAGVRGPRRRRQRLGLFLADLYARPRSAAAPG